MVWQQGEAGGGQVGGAWFGMLVHQLKHAAATALPPITLTHASLTALSNQRTSVNTLDMLLIAWNWNLECHMAV